MISSEVDKEVLFWKVDEINRQLVATDRGGDASLFYIIPAEDTTTPSDFHITNWPGKERHGGTVHVDNLYRTHSKDGPPLPFYLSCDTDIFGKGRGTSPLTLKNFVKLNQIRFCLHSRVQSSFFMCTSTPVSLNSWFGGEKFLIKCSNPFYKMNGYLAIDKKTQHQTQQLETSSQSQEWQDLEISRKSHEVTVVSSLAVGSNPDTQGMLFKLHPKSAQDSYKAAEATANMSLASSDTQQPEISV